MSLPPAQKNTTENPPANAVADPVDKAKKNADVDRKIRLYGVIEALRNGRYPTNEQIDHALTYVVNHSPVSEDKLSPEGRKLIQDTRDIIETARLMVQEKNSDELFQNFLWHTRDVSLEDKKKDPNDVLPVDREKAKQDGQKAVQHLRTLLTLIATNSEVRKLLSDFSLIGRDLLARGAAKAADSVRPDPDALANIDRPAPQDEFQTAGGQKVGPDETPVAEVNIPIPGHEDAQIRHHPKEGTEVEHEGEVRKGDEAVQEAKERAQGTSDQAAKVAGEQVQSTQEELDDENTDPEMKKQGLKARFQNMKNGLTDRVPQEHKDAANEKAQRAHKFLTEEYFPEERRDQFIYRGKKVIIECQKHSDYQESIRWLLNFAEEYASHTQKAVGAGKQTHQQATGDPALKTATTELRTLLERFANGQSMDSIFDAINRLVEDTRNDEEFRNWFRGVDSYVRKILLEPGYVLEPACNTEGRELRESGRRFYDEKYKSHFDGLFETIGNWFRAMGEDPLNKRFGDDWARLTKDLLFDNDGSLKFKPELWMDIRKVILPALVDQVGYIPIPRVEYTDDSLDLVVENLTLQGRNLFPNIISVEAHNYFKFSPYNAIKDENHHQFTLTFGQMQADMRDVAFYFKKKSGIPKLSDSGLADVLLGGHGLTATVHLHSSDKDPSSVFKVHDVKVKVDSLKFSIRDSKHDILYKTLRPLATGLIKKQIQKAVEDAITTGMEYVDGQLVEVRNRMREAGESDEKSRTQALQELFSRKKDEAQSVKSNNRNSQFKVVGKRESAIIPDAGHAAGWANRAQERVDEGKHGKDWRSDAFNAV
ncbi:hypothetical protein DENSPDRAFT_867808 [Dentipellis sp. KUC8613]|nr:hypothetical protein DENSPDRAFT_867808 [Dentipellis sp. KUC8613]